MNIYDPSKLATKPAVIMGICAGTLRPAKPNGGRTPTEAFQDCSSEIEDMEVGDLFLLIVVFLRK